MSEDSGGSLNELEVERPVASLVVLDNTYSLVQQDCN
jgi:hypothetical protein